MLQPHRSRRVQLPIVNFVLSMGIIILAFVFISPDGRAQAENGPLYNPKLPDFSTITISTTKIRDNVYMFMGGPGANIIALVGPDGVLLVDAQYAELTQKIVEAIRRVTNAPIRFVINTHVHPDHVGGNENFAKMGALIFGADEVRSRLLHGVPDNLGFRLPAKPIEAPVVTYGGLVTIHIDDEDVELVRIPHAHTDGDTLVRFAVADLVMTGDTYWNASDHGYVSSTKDLSGSVKGIIAGLGVAIGMSGPNTKIIPSHGSVVDRASLIAQRDILLAIWDRVQQLAKQGKSQEEVIAAHPTADFDAQVVGGKQNADRLLRQIYAEIKIELPASR